MRSLEALAERLSRQLSRRTSRRSFMSKLGVALIGATTFPVLPVARGEVGSHGAALNETGLAADPGDPTSCDYWRYCGFDGFMCSWCGGSHNQCPPGTEPSTVTWIGTCRNPADGKDYFISYNDCCGKSVCGRGPCARFEGAEPMYRPFRSSTINWCLAAKSHIYNCTTALVVGVAAEQ